MVGQKVVQQNENNNKTRFKQVQIELKSKHNNILFYYFLRFGKIERNHIADVNTFQTKSVAL